MNEWITEHHADVDRCSTLWQLARDVMLRGRHFHLTWVDSGLWGTASLSRLKRSDVEAEITAE